MSPGRSLRRIRSSSGRSAMVLAEVDHHRNTGQRAGLDRVLDRRPRRALEVRGLDADDDVAMPSGHLDRRLHAHVGDVLLEGPAAHAVADDVEEREHARLRAADHPIVEVLEVAPSGTAGIGDRRDAGPEREPVGIDAVVARVGSAFAGARVDVRVDVHQAQASHTGQTRRSSLRLPDPREARRRRWRLRRWRRRGRRRCRCGGR